MTKEIILKHGEVALVDNEDYDYLNSMKWRANSGYAYTYINGTSEQIPMHRIILNPPEGIDVDHINRNRLDNRRCNLRLASRSQNLCNKEKLHKEESHSKYKGVTINNGSYQVRVYFEGIKKFHGTFDNEIAAANAYNFYAQKFHGEFALLNNCKYMSEEMWKSHMFKSSSQYRGVHWHQREQRWRSSYKFPSTGMTEVFGFYDSEIAAANMFNHMLKGRIDDKKLNNINPEDYLTIEECDTFSWKRKNNTSRYRGVSWNKKLKKWSATLCYKGKNKNLGSYESEVEAALAFNEKAIELNIDRLEQRLNKIGGE